MMSYGDDFSNLLGTFFIDYWYLVLLAIALIALSEFLIRKIPSPENQEANLKTYLPQSLALLVFVPLLMILGRGGLGVRPVGILHAGKFVELKNIPLVLNTGFTFIKSINDVPLEEKNYLSAEEVKTQFNPIKTFGGNPRYKNQNVVLLILESFSQEFIGTFSGKESFTPFLDSLCDKSMVFPNFWANGKRSIEALPGIANSIPSLMETPYISSSFSGNDIHSLPDELKKINYDSYFFHGASNGSMNFDAYCKAIGYDKYYGRDQYNNEEHFDGNWGIYDEYFLPWSAREIPDKENPFFATIFSLSSHHPYKIPEKHRFKFKEGPDKIFKAINYADYCLEQFFDEAKKQDWYENTIFIITADHTADSKDKYYGDRLGQYSIPLVVFHPNDEKMVGINETTSQQADIFPSVLDLVSEKESKIYSFGNSLFSSDSSNFAINYANGLYYYFESDFDKAEAPFEEAYQLNPYNFNVLNNYGSMKVQQQKFAEAVPIYLKALDINPNHPPAIQYLGLCYKILANQNGQDQINTQKWLDYSLQLNRLEPNNPAILLDIGIAYCYLRDCQKAVEYLKDIMSVSGLPPEEFKTANRCIKKCGGE